MNRKSKLKWLDRYTSVEPSSQYIAALRLEAAYPKMPILRKVFYGMDSLLNQSKTYSDEWLKWMLLSAIELSDIKYTKRLADQYLRQLKYPDPVIQAVAFELAGDRAAAAQAKKSISKTDLSEFGPRFKKRFNGL